MLEKLINMYTPTLNFLDVLINSGVQIRKGDSAWAHFSERVNTKTPTSCPFPNDWHIIPTHVLCTRSITSIKHCKRI